MISRLMVFSVLIASMAFSFALSAAVGVNGGELKLSDYVVRPQQEIQGLMQDNDKKGKDLFDKGQYKESIPWLERSAFFSRVLIEQAKLREQELKEEAKRQELARAEEAKRLEQARAEEAKRLEQARAEEARLRAEALKRLNEARKEVESAKQRAKK